MNRKATWENTGDMAASTKPLKIGVIAEEDNDVDVLYELTRKIIEENQFSFKQFVGKGCGKLRKKCRAWAVNLLERGCALLVVMHDLDERNVKELRFELGQKINGVGFEKSIVLIPIQELEAWLLADPVAIKTVFNMRRLPRIPNNPESMTDPKGFLGKLVSRNSKSHYVNTIHNRRIAAALNLKALGKCPAFSGYPTFLKLSKRQNRGQRSPRKA